MFAGLQMTDVCDTRWYFINIKIILLNFRFQGAGGDGNPFLPFVQGMMQSLLSAEVLLPSLKELLEKYPVWLEANADKIDAAEKERYFFF